MGRSRDIADFLSKTEAQNTANVKLLHASSNVGVDSAYVSSQTGTIGLTYYNTLDSLPISGLSSGDQAYVAENSRLYLSNGSGWFNAALIRLSPTMTLDPSGAITLATDGATTSTVTIIPADSDTPSSQLSFSVESDGSMLGRAVLSQDSSVFTIRPLSADSGATNGTFTLTFKTTDADTNFATASTDFSLTFATTVDSSANTVLLMKASGIGKAHEGISYQYGSDPILENVGFTTNTGTPIATSFSPYRSGGYSTYFDGTGDYLTTGASTDFAFGTGDFTWEMWVYHTEYETAYLLEFGTGGNLGIHHATAEGHLTYYTSTTGTGSTLYTTGFGSMTVGQWYHIAAVRNNGTTYLYTDGVLQTSAADTTNYGSSAIQCRLGAYGNGGTYPWTGYVRDLRIVKGTAVYTSAFTPPTETLTAISGTSLLLAHLPYIADGSSTGHSVTVNGDVSTKPFGPYDYNPFTLQTDVGSTFLSTSVSGMAETTNHQTISNFGSGDFTIELWYYPTTLGTLQCLYTGRSNTSQYAHVSLFVNNTGQLLSYGTSTGSSWDLVAEGGTTIKVTKNTWNHIAYVRNGNTWTMYVNGVGEVVSTNSGTVTANSNIQIGYENTNQFHQGAGYISDYRIVKGSAVYTSNFTPPTEKLTWITNTTLQLQNRYDTFIYDAAAGNEFKLLADAQSSTTQRKFTTSSSVYFDGSGDYIEIPNRQDMLTFGTGDFTIECWFRPSVVNINTAIMDFRPNSTAGSYPFIQPNNTDLKFQNVSSGTLTASGVLSANTWIHIAVVRKNGTTTLYTDGVSRDTGADTTDYGCRSVPNIGKHNYAGSNLNGYLQDLRITKGYGRYTANFTPPTAEFEL